MKVLRRHRGLFHCVLLLLSWLPLAAAPSRADGTPDLIEEIDRAAATQAAPLQDLQIVRGPWPLIRFFAPTLAVAMAIGVCGAVFGTFTLRRGEALLSLALPQAVAVGAAVGMRMGWPELPPAMATVAIALAVFARERRLSVTRRRGPTVVPAVYIAALCLSFLIIAHGGQHVEELQNLFTGVDVAVTPVQACLVAPVLVACGGACALLWRRWLLLAQLPASAELAGVSVARWHGAFLAGLALYVLLGTATQGVVMALAMLFLPATIVAPWTSRLPTAMAAAAGVATVMVAAAFALSNSFSWPLSHSVGGVGLALLSASGLVRAACRRHGRRRNSSDR